MHVGDWLRCDTELNPKSKTKDVINDCQLYFHFDAISDVITKRKQKFMNNYQSSDNLLCSVVCST